MSADAVLVVVALAGLALYLAVNFLVFYVAVRAVMRKRDMALPGAGLLLQAYAGYIVLSVACSAGLAFLLAHVPR